MDPGDPILDPVTTLAFLAGRTRSVQLGTGVIVLPFRNPLIFAKELATVDVLSGGRLIFGIGVGYVQREFEALGVPYAGRGARTEEYLAAIRAVWTEPHPSYQGDLISFKGVQANPRPVQSPPGRPGRRRMVRMGARPRRRRPVHRRARVGPRRGDKAR